MVFNGGGSDLWKADTGATTDPLLDSYLANKAQFRWISHTYTHPFLGCIQIAATVIGGTWHCATSATETPRMDAEIPGAVGPDGVYYATQAFITQQLQDNITFATTNALPNFDPTQLVSGEHSGLATLPQQPADNPFFAPALAGLGITWTASDASRETDTRAVSGGTTSTVPRHPMNIFYNAGTYQDEVDEYNWIYNSTTDGGSGICTANPATSTCIAPLDASSEAAATTSFDSYIKPLEIRNALRYVLTNDPRPFYVHQSNLTEDRIVYPVLDGILATYNGAFDATKTPLVQTDLAGQGQALDPDERLEGRLEGRRLRRRLRRRHRRPPAGGLGRGPAHRPHRQHGDHRPAGLRRRAVRLGRGRQHRRSADHRGRLPGRAPPSRPPPCPASRRTSPRSRAAPRRRSRGRRRRPTAVRRSRATWSGSTPGRRPRRPAR